MSSLRSQKGQSGQEAISHSLTRLQGGAIQTFRQMTLMGS